MRRKTVSWPGPTDVVEKEPTDFSPTMTMVFRPGTADEVNGQPDRACRPPGMVCRPRDLEEEEE